MNTMACSTRFTDEFVQNAESSNALTTVIIEKPVAAPVRAPVLQLPQLGLRLGHSELLNVGYFLLALGAVPRFTPMSPLRDRILQARESSGLSRAALARRVGVSPSAAVQWEEETAPLPAFAT